MRRTIPFLLFLMLLAPTAAIAAPANVEAGLSPESRFYWFDRMAERITLLFTLDTQDKSQALSKIGLERLAEAEEVESQETVGSLISDYLKNQRQADDLAGDDPDTLVGLNEDQAEALERLDGLIEQSRGEHEQLAVQAIATTARLLEKQAKKLEQAALSGSTNVAEKTARAIDKTMTRLKKLADKITKRSAASATISEKKTADELSEHVLSATAKHLAVLEGLLGKVSDSAKPAIEKALERSGKGREKAGEAVKRRGPNAEAGDDID